MFNEGRSWSASAAAVILTLLLLTQSAAAQSSAGVYHQIDGRLQSRRGDVRNLRVRLLKMPENRPIAETFSRPEGQFVFRQLFAGDYIVETFETETFEATETRVSVHPPNPNAPTSQTVLVSIELTLRPAPERPAPGVVAADVDTNVPRAALEHYRSGMKALAENNSSRALTKFKAAIDAHPGYYAARLEMGRELRLQKRYREAEEILRPLGGIAPKQAEPRIELGAVLLALNRRSEAVEELRASLRLEEPNWTAHLYMGWALLETDAARAETHFKRALELNEQKAAKAHLALARLADARGERQAAIAHLDAYLALAPNAPEAEQARQLADRLRSLK